MAAALVIAERIRAGSDTIGALMKEYHVGYPVLMRAVLQEMTFQEYRQLTKKKMAVVAKGTRFIPGCAAWNKGKKVKVHPNSIKTQFKKGGIRGAAARKFKAVGQISIHRTSKKGGQRESRFIKVRDGGPREGRWIPYAKYVWEKNNGPVPEGYFVVHKDGNRLNDELTNLLVVNHHYHVALQKARDPKKMSGWKKRGDVYGKQRRQINSEHKKMQPKVTAWWECVYCSHPLEGEPPDQCPKCNCGSFEQVTRQEKLYV